MTMRCSSTSANRVAIVSLPGALTVDCGPREGPKPGRKRPHGLSTTPEGLHKKTHDISPLPAPLKGQTTNREIPLYGKCSHESRTNYARITHELRTNFLHIKLTISKIQYSLRRFTHELYTNYARISASPFAVIYHLRSFKTIKPS